jgi:3-oxoacyl-[acyl-carrier protein] reductase
MHKRFVGKVAVVTGSAGGLGRALALGYAKEGASLALVDINAAGLAETKALVAAEGAEASTYVADLGDEKRIEALGAELCAKHPKIDVLYNNAGMAYGGVTRMIDAVGLEDWLRYLTVNSLSPLLVSKTLRPSLAAAKGVIINQSSMASNMPSTVYGVTKAMLNSMTFGMANIFGADGIRVNAIEPGIMETEASANALPEETKQRVQGMQLLKLHGVPDDIVNLGLFLSSSDARFITCEVVSCDAGNRLRGWRH